MRDQVASLQSMENRLAKIKGNFPGNVDGDY